MVAANPSGPTRLYFVSLVPAHCWRRNSFLSLPFPSSTSLDSIPLRTPKGLLALTAILHPRLVLFAPSSLSSHLPIESPLQHQFARVLLVSIRSSRLYFLHKDNFRIPTTPPTSKMPAIEKSALIAREAFTQLVKREKNWAAREPGVIVVFCIVFIVAVGLTSLFVHKKMVARRAAKQTI